MSTSSSSSSSFSSSFSSLSSSFSSFPVSSFTAGEDDAMIARVRENGVLYDAAHAMYKDGMHKDYIWHQIGAAVGRTPDECKKRWRNMRNTYKKRVKRSLTQSPPKKHWHLMGPLSFLDQAERSAKTKEVAVKEAAVKKVAAQEDGGSAAAKNGGRGRAAPDSVDLFFSSVALNVKRLPTRAINKAQMKTLALVAQLEDEYAHPAPFLHHMPPAGYRYTDFRRARSPPGPTSVPARRERPPFGDHGLCVAYDVLAPK